MTPLVSIVIPVFNRWELTKQCLDHLKDTTKNFPVEVIVVDNNSTDGTWEGLETYYDLPNMHCIHNQENRNFSGACNQGADAAKGTFLCFLNNDTIPFENWLDPLIDELMNDSNIGIVGSKLCFPNGTIQHAGVAFMRETRFPYHPYRGLSCEDPKVNHRRELKCVTGACMAMTKETFQSSGGFDPGFINGGEDVDLCVKVWHQGKKIIYQPKSALIHLESQSPGRLDFNEQNIKYFYERWPDMMLADEDAIYFEDDLHRIGDRLVAHMVELTPITSEKENNQWAQVAEVQYWSFGNLKYEGWPEDAAVREWAGLMCREHGYYREGLDHMIAAARLRAAEIAHRCQAETQSRTILSPLFNKFFV